MTISLLKQLSKDGIRTLAEYHDPHFRLAKSQMLNKRRAELLRVADLLYARLLPTTQPASPRTLNGILTERDAVKRMRSL